MSEDLETRDLFPDLGADGALRAAFQNRARPSTEVARTAPSTGPGDGAGQRGYELRGEIARGGMGVIIQAFDRELDRDVALKVLRDELAGEPQLVRRFFEEARVTARLDHPGIVPVHEVGRDPEGRAYFAMRLVRGRELKRIIELSHANAEGWSQARALSVIQKVCEAMAYAHEKGVIHRDLKPSNVMVGEFGEVYVMDWGLARTIGSEDAHDLRLRNAPRAGESSRTRTSSSSASNVESPIVTMDGEVLGTPCYMAPEQAEGRIAELGPRSDVYSVGAMLYHLLAGEMPFVPAGTHVASRTVLSNLVQGPPRPLHALRADMSPELIALCEKAMSREPKERYPDMLAMANDLRAFLERRVVSAYETGAWAEARKWVQRNKPLAAALAGAVVLLIAGLTASLVFKARADEKATDVLKLSAFQTLDDLSKEADALWPAEPGLVERYRLWMTKAEELVRKLPEFRASLAEIDRRAAPLGEHAEDRSGGETGDRWWHGQMLKLIAALESFGDEKTGLINGVSEAHGWGVGLRLEFASSVEQRTVVGADAMALWSAASAAIAASPKYGGLKLTPQLGLLPIGLDPQSGLWEFAHVQSGEPAVPGADETLGITEEMGLVFVLIPGGTFWMGAQKTDASGQNYDPLALDSESPVHEVTLSPYFLSKYEMTQGQWERFTGKNPSDYGPSTRIGGHQHDLTHPVEQISWMRCMEVMSRLGLQLPTEAQWEYGCRGGTNTPWWTGAQRESLRGRVNIADQTAAKSGAPWADIKDWPDLEDGWAAHAPVGSMSANPYGLHEVHGNVWEWCRDGFGDYSAEKQVDPVAPSAGAQYCVGRGGSFYNSSAFARSSSRLNSPPETADGYLGLRPARAVTLADAQVRRPVK